MIDLRDVIDRARAVIAEAAVLPEAKAARMAARVQTGKPDSRRPDGSSRGTLDEVIATIRRARTPGELAVAVERAEQLVDEIKYGPDVEPESIEAWRWRLVHEHEGRNYRTVAGIEKVSEAYVRKIRQEHGRDPRLGLPIPDRGQGAA